MTRSISELKQDARQMYDFYADTSLGTVVVHAFKMIAELAEAIEQLQKGQTPSDTKERTDELWTQP